MSPRTTYEVRPIGRVRSSLRQLADAPRQGDEGAPDARVLIDAEFASGLDGIAAGQNLLLLTWLHEARRDVLVVHSRGEPSRPLSGVFTTRSPDRPNPIGLHRVRVPAVEPEGVLHVSRLEAIDGTPVLDLKPVLSNIGER